MVTHSETCHPVFIVGEETGSKETPSLSGVAKAEPGCEEEEQCPGGHCETVEVDGPVAVGKEAADKLTSEGEPDEISSLVFVPHPTDWETFVDFGMHVTTTEVAEGKRQHTVVEVMPGGMAEQVGLK